MTKRKRKQRSRPIARGMAVLDSFWPTCWFRNTAVTTPVSAVGDLCVRASRAGLPDQREKRRNGGCSRRWLLEPFWWRPCDVTDERREATRDDTPVPVLAPGKGVKRTGRLQTYGGMIGPGGDQTPPAVVRLHAGRSQGRAGEHPIAHFAGVHGHAAGGWIRGVREAIYSYGRVKEAAHGACSQAVL